MIVIQKRDRLFCLVETWANSKLCTKAKGEMTAKILKEKVQRLVLPDIKNLKIFSN